MDDDKKFTRKNNYMQLQNMKHFIIKYGVKIGDAYLVLATGEGVLFLSELRSLVFISLISASLNCSSDCRDRTCAYKICQSCFKGLSALYICVSISSTSSPSCWAPSPCRSALSASESPGEPGAVSEFPFLAELLSESLSGHGSHRSSTESPLPPRLTNNIHPTHI